jgi:predicted dehydrogenase
LASITIVPRHVLGGPSQTAPSDRVNVALVGAGGRGLQNARELMQLADVRITAVADPAERWDLSGFYYGGVAGRGPTCREIEKHYQDSEPSFRCQAYADYRQMLESASSDFDAVLCATPDHLHALVSISAMRAGKHVYCEKPLTHNIAEARLVAEVAKQTGLATQMGNQGHSKDTIRETVELLRSGVIGDVHEVHAWVQTSRWNPTLQHPPTTGQPVPKGLNWDLWCGPRTPTPFDSAYAPVSWRDFWRFGCGALGDMGCHDLDSTVWAFDLEHPDRVEMRAAGSSDPNMAPYGEIGYFDFTSRSSGQASPLRVHWYSGGLKPRTPDLLPTGQDLPGRGTLFVGSQGILLCGAAGGNYQLFPESLRDTPQPSASLTRSHGHHRDWVDAIKGGPPASSNFQYGSKLTEIVLLGLLALRTGEIIHWNAQAMKALGVPQADSIIHEQYRDGWSLES